MKRWQGARGEQAQLDPSVFEICGRQMPQPAYVVCECFSKGGEGGGDRVIGEKSSVG